MDERLKEQTRSEWRKLGFFYDRDDNSREWILVGSRSGLHRFADLLRAYASDARNEMLSEHEHYGPYMYLEVMTSSEAGMDEHAIHGPLNELRRLAHLVEEKIGNLDPGGRGRIREEFAPTSEYALILDLREDTFDPATADGNLREEAG